MADKVKDDERKRALADARSLSRAIGDLRRAWIALTEIIEAAHGAMSAGGFRVAAKLRKRLEGDISQLQDERSQIAAHHDIAESEYLSFEDGIGEE